MKDFVSLAVVRSFRKGRVGLSSLVVLMGLLLSALALGFLVQGSSPAVPSNLAASATSLTSIRLTWTDNSNNETGFQIYRSTDGINFGVNPVRTTAADATAWTNSNLTTGTTYYYKVRAKGNGSTLSDSGDSNIASVKLDTPSNPSNLTAAIMGYSGFQMAWQDNSDNETAFEVEEKVNNGSFALKMTLPANMTGFNVGGGGANPYLPLPDTTYTWRVRARNGSITSGYSNETSIHTASAPPAPTNLTASNISENSVTLSWVSDGGFLKVERRPITSSTWSEAQVDALGGTTATDATVSPSTTYAYRVYNKGTYWSPPSAELVVTTTGSLPAAPANLTATATGDAQISLSWTDYATNEASFKLQHRLSGTTTWSTITVPANSGTGTVNYVHSGLAPEETRDYRVRASNTAGVSNFTATVPATTLSLAAPTNLAVLSGEPTAVRMVWEDNSQSEDAYIVERKAPGGVFEEVASLAANTSLYDDSSLEPGTEYEFRVRAARLSTRSNYSNIASTTTASEDAGEQIEAMAVATSSSSIAIYWKAYPNASSYILLRSTSENGTYSQIAGPFAPTDPAFNSGRYFYRDTAVFMGTTYYYEIKPVIAAGFYGPGSNIPYATPSSNAIPWDSTAEAIVTKANEQYSWSIPGWDPNGVIKAVAPNGVVTFGRVVNGQYNSSSPFKSLEGNVITDSASGMSYPKTIDADMEMPVTPNVNEVDIPVNDATGPFRKVVAAAGHTTMTSTVYLPDVGSTDGPHYNSGAGDTGWVYTGGDGTVQQITRRGNKVAVPLYLDIGFSKGLPDNQVVGWGPDGWYVLNGKRVKLSILDDAKNSNVNWSGSSDKLRVKGSVFISMALPNGTSQVQQGVFSINTMNNAAGQIVTPTGAATGVTSINCVFSLPGIHSVAASGNSFRIKRVTSIAQECEGSFAANWPTNYAANRKVYYRYSQGMILPMSSWGNQFDNDLSVKIGGSLLEDSLVHLAGAAPGPPASSQGGSGTVSRRILFPYYAEDQIVIRTKS